MSIGGKTMEKISLKSNEQYKYDIIKQLVDNNNSNNTREKKRAAIKLGCTVRNVNRLILVYKKSGKAGFVHGNRGKAPAIKYPDDIKRKVVELYKSKYQDTNFAHFSRIIENDLGLKISPRTINNWLCREEHILSPKAKQITRDKYKKISKK